MGEQVSPHALDVAARRFEALRTTTLQRPQTGVMDGLALCPIRVCSDPAKLPPLQLLIGIQIVLYSRVKHGGIKGPKYHVVDRTIRWLSRLMRTDGGNTMAAGAVLHIASRRPSRATSGIRMEV